MSDGSKGLDKALYSDLYRVPHQRCIFHKIKHITDHLQYAALKADIGTTASAMSRQVKQERKRHILADEGQIYAMDVEVEIRSRVQDFGDKLEDREL